LTSKFGGNVHDRDVVTITAGRAVSDDSSFAPKNVADLGSASHFHSTGDPNQWIGFDFKGMKVRPSHYTIRSYSSGPNGHHLKEWVIEGSDDGKSWAVIDRRVNNADLNNALAVKTFQVREVGTFRMIRLRQTGPSHSSCNYLIFSGFEVFWSLFGPE
jgi:hypothetical protein